MVLFGLLSTWFVAFADEGDPSEPEEPDATEPEQVVVTAYRFADASGDAPFSTTVLEESEIGLGRPTLEMGEALSQVPGVFVANRSNFAQDTRLSIRGFGTRAAFGIRGIRVILDGIPLTLPDGQSQVDSLDFANIGRIEVLRGAAGSLYGNAAGGVLVLETKRPTDQPEAELVNTLGAFGLFKSAIGARTTVGKTDVSLFASRTALGGWRQQSSVEQVAVQSYVATPLAPNIDWSANIHYVRAPTADDPGGLTLEDFEANPQAAAQTNLDSKTGEDLSQLQIGSRLVLTPAPAHRFEVVGHAGVRTFDGRIPFQLINFNRDFFGGFATYRWRAGLGILNSQLAVGLELQGQQDSRRNEGNDNGLPNGEIRAHQNEQVNSFGAFVQERLDVGERVRVLGSARFDRVEFSLTDRLLADGDVSGARTFNQGTGQGGVLVRIVDRLSAFANIAQSFETPAFSELVNSSGDGGLDPDLQAQRALTVEGGVQVNAPNYQFQASGFYIDLQNELIRQEDDEGRAFFTNAGLSRRFGAEVFAQYQPLRWLEFRGSYSWLRAEFREPDRIGVIVPGIPEHRGFLRARFMKWGFHAAAEGEFVGGQFADDANMVEADAYGLLGIRAGYTLTLLDPVEFDLTIGARNLLNVSYVDNTRINAVGGRYFEGGLPRHFYGQLTIRYR